MALGVIHAAQDTGLNVPTDVEVLGFDNTRLALMVRPQLSTVVQPMYDIGAVAMRLLTKYMNKEKVEDHTVILPHRINLEIQRSKYRKAHSDCCELLFIFRIVCLNYSIHRFIFLNV